MKRLYVHVGLSKTGSSSLQSWLSLNAVVLSTLGIDYADLDPSAKDGKISAGNGVPLFFACQTNNHDEIERLITEVYFAHSSKAIISSEIMQQASPESLECIKEVCAKHSITPVVILFARSAYELLYSNYMQGVKRHGYTSEFGQDEHLSYAPQRHYIDKYLHAFPRSLIACNYDSIDTEICEYFANLIGIEFHRTQRIEFNVNRSLTFGEANLLKSLNAMHDGVFSMEISDFVIEAHPDKPTSTFYSATILDQVIKACRGDIDWLNQYVFVDQPLSFSRVKLEDLHGIEPADFLVDLETLETVVQWCESFQPTLEQRELFSDFLTRFAVFLNDYDTALQSRVACNSFFGVGSSKSSSSEAAIKRS